MTCVPASIFFYYFTAHKFGLNPKFKLSESLSSNFKPAEVIICLFQSIFFLIFIQEMIILITSLFYLKQKRIFIRK